MSKVVYKGVEYSGDAVVTLNLNNDGYTQAEIDAKLANKQDTIDTSILYNPTNKETLNKISEDATNIKPVFNGKNLAYEEEIDTKITNGLTDYIKKTDALSTFATNSLMTSTISDVAVLKSRMDNINDDVQPTNCYSKDEVDSLLASAQVGALVHFDDLTTAQKQQIKGDKGDKGNKGDKGDSAYESAKKLGYTDTEEAWLETLKGKSAYQLAVAEGYSYTQAEWLQSLKGEKGDKGDKGDSGKSAYQIAVENGLTSASTQAAWIAELKGEKGDSITSVKQTTTSTENGGINKVTCTLSTGATSEFSIKNGEGITSVKQTGSSNVSEGVNTITCTLSNGNTSTFTIKNGERGEEGYALLPSTQPTDLIVGKIWLA